MPELEIETLVARRLTVQLCLGWIIRRDVNEVNMDYETNNEQL